RPWNPAVARDEAVFAEMLLVEKHRGAEVVLVGKHAGDELAVALYVDAEIGDQRFRGVAVRIRRRDAHRAAVADEGASAVAELVALRVAAKIVMIVENEHF